MLIRYTNNLVSPRFSVGASCSRYNKVLSILQKHVVERLIAVQDWLIHVYWKFVINKKYLSNRIIIEDTRLHLAHRKAYYSLS